MEHLDERKLSVIEDLCEGVLPKTEIAKKHGISRQAIYQWMDDDLFNAELANRLQVRKSAAEKKIDSQLNYAINEVMHTIQTTRSHKVKAELLKYIIDRALGTPSSRHELSIDNKNDNNQNVPNKDVLDEEHERFMRDMEDIIDVEATEED